MDDLFSQFIGFEGIFLLSGIVLVSFWLVRSYQGHGPDKRNAAASEAGGVPLAGGGFKTAKTSSMSIRRAARNTAGKKDAPSSADGASYQAGRKSSPAGGRSREKSLTMDVAAAGAAPVRAPQSRTSQAYRHAGLEGDASHRGEYPLIDEPTQWHRVSRLVEDGLGKAREIEDLHDAASRQLDAVDYAYERMLHELKDILPGVAASVEVVRANRSEAYQQADAPVPEAPEQQAPGVAELEEPGSSRAA